MIYDTCNNTIFELNNHVQKKIVTHTPPIFLWVYVWLVRGQYTVYNKSQKQIIVWWEVLHKALNHPLYDEIFQLSLWQTHWNFFLLCFSAFEPPF